MDEAEEQALARVRALRRDGYRCRYPACGAFSAETGTKDGEVITLCRHHA